VDRVGAKRAKLVKTHTIGTEFQDEYREMSFNQDILPKDLRQTGKLVFLPIFSRDRHVLAVLALNEETTN
jgi:hypothetical protein